MLVVVVGGVLFLLLRTTEEDRVEDVADRFVTAVDTQDQRTMVELLCASEAAAVTGDDDYDPAYDGYTSGFARARSLDDVRISGDAASVRLTRPDQEASTLYLLRENGVWKVCASAQGKLVR
ncbi:hypothetical protein GCM10027445_27050 [Amycolatopsis endophytica]